MNQDKLTPKFSTYIFNKLPVRATGSDYARTIFCFYCARGLKHTPEECKDHYHNIDDISVHVLNSVNPKR